MYAYRLVVGEPLTRRPARLFSYSSATAVLRRAWAVLDSARICVVDTPGVYFKALNNPSFSGIEKNPFV